MNAGPLEASGHRNTFGKIINHAAGTSHQAAVGGSGRGRSRGRGIGSADMNRIGNRRQLLAPKSVDSAQEEGGGGSERVGQVSFYF